jgi:hypothetical protein
MIPGVVRSCMMCPSHQVRDEEGVPSSHCSKENCWARFSKCLRYRALEAFLAKECLQASELSQLLGEDFHLPEEAR